MSEPTKTKTVLVYICRRCSETFDEYWADGWNLYGNTLLHKAPRYSTHECRGGKGLGRGDLIALEQRPAEGGEA